MHACIVEGEYCIPFFLAIKDTFYFYNLGHLTYLKFFTIIDMIYCN